MDLAYSTKITVRPEERRTRRVVLSGQTPEGEYILSVLVKRTYDIRHGQSCVRSEKDEKLHTADVHFDDPTNSSVRFESDFVPFKLATDVVLNGKAYSPGSMPTTELNASLQVGERIKSLAIIGDRTCHFRQDGSPLFSDPLFFESMELGYERAYGGVDIFSDVKIPFPYGRNPLGRGFAVMNSNKTVQGLPLPNVEDPTDKLTPDRLCCGGFADWEKQPMPVGFGWFPKNWMPRSLLAGILPADRTTERELRLAYAQLVPVSDRETYLNASLPDMNFHFFNGASTGLAVPYLQGTEIVKTINLCPEGVCEFCLPGDQVKIAIDIGQGFSEPQVVIQTVMIRMEERKLDIVWRGAATYPGPDWLSKLETMDVVVQ